MDKFDVFCVAVMITIIGILMLGFGFVIGVYANDEVVTIEKIVEVEVHELSWCLDQIEEGDLFQKALSEKEWMRK